MFPHFFVCSFGVLRIPFERRGQDARLEPKPASWEGVAIGMTLELIFVKNSVEY